MIKTSTTGYVIIKKYNLFGTPCVPSGAVRDNLGKREAQFICFMRKSSERDVWVSREDLCTDDTPTKTS